MRAFLRVIALLYATPSIAQSWRNDTWPENSRWQPHDIAETLGRRLSPHANISHNGYDTNRWSTFKAPKAGMVVDVATEDDVLWTVRYCIHNSIPFLAQNGGNAWSTTFHLPRQTSAFIGRISPNDTYSAVVNTTASNSTNILTAQLPSSILINLRNLNNISFSLPPVITTYNTTSTNATVTIGGGVLISDLVTAAHAHSVQIQTGNCNCVGMLGALLGGGYSRFQGLYGLGVDNILSVNMITAAGELLTIGAKEEEEEGSIQGKSKNDADTGTDDDTTAKEDLWWAIRGAGPNFGIITSATLKAYPMPDKSKSGAWLATLLFDESKLEQLVSAMEALDLGAHMAIFLYFFAPLPDCTPSIVAELFYANTDALTARAAFRSIYDVGGWREDAASTGFKEYDKVNEGSEMFCAKDGARKPTYGAGLAHVSPVAMRAIWEEYKAFLKVGGNGTEKSAVLVEKYPMDAVLRVPDAETAYPWRSRLRYNAAAIAWYQDPALDARAEAWGKRVREWWRGSGGLGGRCYVNYAFGDEGVAGVYGDDDGGGYEGGGEIGGGGEGGGLQRLKAVKKAWDGQGRFSEFFPLL